MKAVFIVLILAFLFSCSLVPEKHYYSFDEVSDPFLDKYGPPEETESYSGYGSQSISWWWWTRGEEVTFTDSEYDSIDGWSVSTYSFSPIY